MEWCSPSRDYVPFPSPFSKAMKEIQAAKLSGSKTLLLHHLGIIEVPRCISILSDTLQRIDLSYNCLSSLPIEIGTLTHIKEIKLCSNYSVPFSVPPTIGKLTGLVNLKLSGNSLTSLPDEIGNIVSMKILDLSHNQLSTLPVLPSGLLVLQIDHNLLSEVPSALNEFVQHLSLSYNPRIATKVNWFEPISLLLELKQLELRGCGLKEWPSSLCLLSNLCVIDVGSNQISTLPDGSLSAFPQLEMLYLDKNQLTEIPEDIGKCISLRTLTLDGNTLQEVPFSIRHLSALEKFTIDDENMLVPPRDIVRKGWTSIKSFLESLAEESLPCYRIRLLILGSPRTGKSSLLRRLSTLKNVKKGNQRNEIESKHVDIKQLNLSCKTQDNKLVTVKFSCWDFGSTYQDIFHSFFIAPRSIFIVTVDLREVAKKDLNYWLTSIFTRAGARATVFIVCTHVDDKMFKEESQLHVLLHSIADDVKKFDIRQIRVVSCSDGTGIDELKTTLVEEALTFKHVGRITTKQFTLLEEELESFSKLKLQTGHPPLLNWSEYTAIATTCHIHTYSTLRTATSFLNDLGILLHFHDDLSAPHSFPSIILDPNWIIELICILMEAAGKHAKNSILQHDALIPYLSVPTYPKKLHGTYISLLREFGILHRHKENSEFFPALLPKSKADLEVLWSRYDSSRVQYERVWKFTYVPFGFFPLLLSRLCVLTRIYSMWQHGCVFSFQGDWVLIQEYSPSSRICVAVRSSNPNVPVMKLISSLVQQLMANKFPRNDYKVDIQCTHCIENRFSDPWVFSTFECERALFRAEKVLLCQRSDTTEPTAVPIHTIVPDLAMNDLCHLQIEIEEIEMEKDFFAKGAFGVLYRGIYHEKNVAVKILLTEGVSQEQQIEIFQEFRKEVCLMSQMNHPNCVHLQGYTIGNKTNEIGMIMELVDCGDLHDLIHKKMTWPYNRAIYLSLAYDMAQALDYLHSLSPPIIHRDLKPGNILLCSAGEENEWKYCAKLTDFGLSSSCYVASLKERAVETPMWVAPEILSGGSYTSKSDVYAFGVILYELATRKLPYEDFDFLFLTELEEDIVAGKRPSLVEIESEIEVCELIRACWHPHPLLRPTFNEILSMIACITQKIEVNLYKNKILPTLEVWKENKRQLLASTPPPITSTIDGSFIKKIRTKPPEGVECMGVAGEDIWFGHSNGDISIWNAMNGTLFRTIVAAHSRSVKTLCVVGNKVWTGSKDGMIHIWSSRISHPEDVPLTTLKEGYIERGEGRNPIFVSITTRSTSFSDGVPLHNNSVAVSYQEGTNIGFHITEKIESPSSATSTPPASTIFFCETLKEQNEWIAAISLATASLSEKTRDLKIARIAPRKGKNPVHAIVLVEPFIYVANSENNLLSYHKDSFEFVSEHSLFDHSNWKVKPSSARKEETATFLSPKNPLNISQSFLPATTDSFSTKSSMSQSLPTKSGLCLSPSVVRQLGQSNTKLLCFHDRSLWFGIGSSIYRFSTPDIRPRGHLIGHSDDITAMCGTGNELWSCSKDSSIRVWDTQTLQRKYIIPLDGIPCSLLSAGRFVWCGMENEIIILDKTNYQIAKKLECNQLGSIDCLIFVWEKNVWASCLQDKTISIWN